MPILGRAIRGTSISRPGKIWLPQLRDIVKPKIEINDRDVTADILEGRFTWTTIRNGLGMFNIELNNDTRRYLEVFSEGHIVKFIADFTDATTQIFEAKTEEPRYGFDNGFKVFLNGMKNPELASQKFTKSYRDANADNVLKDVLDTKFGTGTFTYNNLSSDMTTLITAEYEEESIINILKDILERVNFDGYIDVNDDVHTFVDTGVLNSSEAAIQGQNILNITPFGKDTLRQRNIVRLYGASVEDMLIIKTSETTTTSWDREEIVKEGSSTTLGDASERASATLTKLNQLSQQGTIKCSALATLRPGNKIDARVPNANIEGTYFIPQYTHIFSTQKGWTTELTVNKLIVDISSIHFDHKLNEETTKELDNPNAMKNTLILLTFDNENDIASLGSCELSNGKLILTSGVDTGLMTSVKFTNTNNFSSVELRGSSNSDFDLGPSFIEVTNNNGTTYKIVNNFKKLTSLTSTGKDGIIRVNIKSNATYPNPVLESLGLLVDT